MKNHSIGSEYWPFSMANAVACRKGPSGETNKPPFAHLLWAVGTMGQHWITQALDGE
ncbi:hypothetical protein ONR69_00140 [Proteus mirabilis]|uniref:hypothetical protein n=1 Tax=Morganellaceae TaxID=1903414 RepID=UPI0018C45B24|nr:MULTISPECIES: hypothetical protein [Morganellaceae]EHZ8012943.1 hypothetical protein [Proteus mirabilis]EKV2708080.1 hypothetical protein [Proteus mirabilis]EKV4066601.1 hypothetical protein [Proteus mirabilis]EMB4673061.1 hypothetical protein [Proteus mirabilis]MBG2816140.1 hypothetical protein [Proteus mirabilis]